MCGGYSQIPPLPTHHTIAWLANRCAIAVALSKVPRRCELSQLVHSLERVGSTLVASEFYGLLTTSRTFRAQNNLPGQELSIAAIRIDNNRFVQLQ
jgi:hypothetical protein